MPKKQRFPRRCIPLLIAMLIAGSAQAQLSDVTQPGDLIIPSSANSPGSEAVANAIDNQPTKYLNFDSGRNGFLPSGFIVTPSVGITHVTGISMQSANDAPERDPKIITLEGSNDDAITNFNSGTWELIVGITNITSWETLFPGNHRFQTQTISFPNARPYRHYRWVVHETQTTPNGCCLQIAEVELLGTTLPRDVTQPGDLILPSSDNSPGSEAVANAIDDQPTKYLNFDSGRGGFLPSGFVVSPSLGRSLVTGISMQSANDAPERDPKEITLEGSNDEVITNYSGGNWELITTISNIPSWELVFPGNHRFRTQTYLFDNYKPYRHYRWVVTQTQTTPNGCCLQIAEVELLGTGAPKDVTQPGDVIVASSANSPGSEAVANAIDDQPTKYLNFDSGRGGFLPSGFAVSPGVGPTTVIGLTMQSANDAPERDPKVVTLEGSNEDPLAGYGSGSWELIVGITNITSWETMFPGNHRFKTQEFYFPNKKAFKHYRWVVHETQTTPNGCCLQIAEVELLAVTASGNTNEIFTLIRRQPEDTPALLGAKATFHVLLTGPWNVQWYRNGTRISGATSPSYTTPNVTAENDGDRYYALVQSPDGQQKSDEIMLSIFTPSTTESIGVNWSGEGANGAPTRLASDDITGFHPQAYWNNIEIGTSTNAVSPVNSSNQSHPTITVQWATSGEWGVGTGDDTPTQRLLNGMATSTGTSEANQQSVTLSGVPAGSHSLLLYTVQVPLEFFNMDFTVTTFDSNGAAKAVQKRYIRPQNSDEYNPAPGFYLVTAETADKRGVGNMMRFDNLQPEDGRILVQFYSPGRVQPPGTETIRGPGLNALQLVVNPGTVPAPPVIARHPASANGFVGGQVTLSVEATGPDLAYQWLKDGKAIPGATTAQLLLSNVQESDEAAYSVIISNPAGRVLSRTALVDILQSAYITAGLTLYYKFDVEDNGLSVPNEVAGGPAGIVTGTEIAFADYIPGVASLALVLDQPRQFFYVPNYTKPSGAMTVSGWVKKSSLGTWGPLANNWVSTNAIGSRGSFTMDLVSVAGGYDMRGQIGVGPNQPVASGPTINTDSDVWHHYALSANGVSLNAYWDGQLVSSLDYHGALNNIASVPWLAVGAELAWPAGDPTPTPQTGIPLLVGSIDDFALWNRSLGEAEIKAIYEGGLAGQDLSQLPPVLIPPVKLNISYSGGNVMVSWPAEETGYVLYSSPSLSNPTWTPVQGISNNNHNHPNPTGTVFYRLIKQ